MAFLYFEILKLSKSSFRVEIDVNGVNSIQVVANLNFVPF